MASKRSPGAEFKNAEQRRQDAKAEVEAAPDGMRVMELYVENIKRVRVAHIKPKGNMVVISGKNGSGKSSLLDAIAWALTGTSTVPSQPIRKGERTGMVKVDVGDYVVTRYFTRVDPEKSAKGNTYITRLLVEGKKREQYPSPQLLLNGVLGKIGYDPLAFIRMEDAKQLETLRGLIGLDLDELEADIQSKYEMRKEAGRLFDSLKARLAALPEPNEDLPAEPINVAEITRQLEGAANHNSIVAQQRAKKASYEEAAESAKRTASEHRAAAARLRAQADEMDERAAEADRIAEESLRLGHNVEIGTEIDTAEVAAKLTQANETNGAIARAAAYRQVKTQLEEAVAAWTLLDKQVKDLNHERQHAIATAKMPLEGLSIGDQEVLYNGLPFSQASNAEQIRVSMALGMASNPKLRILRIVDGSLLDDESMKLVSEAADRHGFQVWVERVDTSGNVGIVMEEGEASGDEVVPEAKG